MNMSKSDLLLEIGLEELPARFVVDSMNQLKDKVTSMLTEKNISFGHVSSFSTPRRLAVLIHDVSEKQSDIKEEVKGPSKKVALDQDGNWSKAAIGFTKGQGKTVEDIYFKEINGVEYVHVEKFIKGQATFTELSAIEEIIKSLNFPKNMRWADFDIRYARPIRWMVALFGDQVIDLQITDVRSGRESFGHRFLGDKISITNPRDYQRQMLSQYVIVDYEERRSAVRSQLKQLEEENQWVIPVDEDLLEEVTNLVEYPTALFGSFDEKFLELPKEVLITTMREHQRYFPVIDNNQELQPNFVTVRNGNHEHLDTVARGNEKVLRARLQDAVFFYEEDQKLSIDKAINKLGNVVYHEEIGTYQDKLKRIESLSKYLLNSLQYANNSEVAIDTLRAAQICKFDLVTQMVSEFPELQGLMGEQYAILAGEKSTVANAINEHYMPRGAEGELPESIEGSIVSVADKLDTLASFFALGMIPTGSQDPYSLRRQATGVAQILLHAGWNVNFIELVNAAVAQTVSFSKQTEEETIEALLAFFNLRFKHMLSEMNIRYDVIDALLETTTKNVKSLVDKAAILNEAVTMNSFKGIAEALSRVINIASKHTGEAWVDVSLFENESEKALYNDFVKIQELKAELDEMEYYHSLAGLKETIDHYFDHTMVMADQKEIRQNRLSLMRLLADSILEFAHFEKIIVK